MIVKTLSKKSTYLSLANQVRQLIKELLSGSYATPDPAFGKVREVGLAREKVERRDLSLCLLEKAG
jgi:hypothetical protein